MLDRPVFFPDEQHFQLFCCTIDMWIL